MTLLAVQSAADTSVASFVCGFSWEYKRHNFAE